MAKMKTVVLFAEWREPLKMLSLEQKGKLLDALLDYPDNGVPEFDEPLLSMAWAFMDRVLEQNKRRYNDICEKRSEAGKLGNEKRWNATNDIASVANAIDAIDDIASVAKTKTKTKTKSKILDTKVSSIEADASTLKKFRPPAIEECTAYFEKKGCSRIEGEKFFDYFTSNGWKVGGKTAMKSWESAANNWIRRYYESHPEQPRREGGRRGQYAGI